MLSPGSVEEKLSLLKEKEQKIFEKSVEMYSKRKQSYSGQQVNFYKNFHGKNQGMCLYKCKHKFTEVYK